TPAVPSFPIDVVVDNRGRILAKGAVIERGNRRAFLSPLAGAFEREPRLPEGARFAAVELTAMTMPTVDEGRIDPVWEAFARRHAGNPFLELDTLYALTEPIIDAIEAHVRNFFTAEQQEFERDLARTARFGFFYQRPLGRAAAPVPEDTDQPSLAERQRRSSEQ